MTTRRTFLLSTVAMLAAPAYSDVLECAVFTKDRQAALDPSGALQQLKGGNARFVGGRSIHCDLMTQVRATATGQAPFAFVQAVAEQKAKDAAALLISRSTVLQELVAAGKLTVSAAMHDITTGVVTWLT